MNKIQLCDINTCTQCHACEQVCPKQCIRFTEGKDGFDVPRIDTDVCVECGACIKSCHQLNLTKPKIKPIHTYAAWSEDNAVRITSSSGGVFSEVARYVFDRCGVVVGAVMDEHLKVHHSFATDMDGLVPMRGSKYVQSDLSDIYSEIKGFLNKDRLVLFSGTPCQVAGLYTFLKKDYPNLLTCDLVCHGVPSQKSFDSYCKRIGLSSKKVAEVAFRYTQGWGLQMTTRNHKAFYSTDRGYKWDNISPLKSYYLRAFTGGLMFDEACYNCHYASPERVSDLTMADYWGIGTMQPFNHSTKKGVSLLLVNTSKGFDMVKGSKGLILIERPFEEAVQGNHNLSNSSERPPGRDTYCDDAEKMSIIKISKKYGLLPGFKEYVRPINRKLDLI